MMELKSNALALKDVQMNKVKTINVFGNTNYVLHALNRIKKFIFESSQIRCRITVSVHLSIILKKLRLIGQLNSTMDSIDKLRQT